ncbi:cysteine--tRNA ligase [Methyloradius palustris]|uniref:Cysteine--tRNA ligase n=1 Tax=Methyloradius palustris TaxID=2778876 RepID=A0A8D5G6R0_9PROT|nr:cysteine--tRNA ligase [Methyloradius palustris]BCM24187.1 cysteine--tRNA ligase [Methyloradius palustris]
MLKIYNTLAREKQLFVPIVAGKVSMYVCGMTVYDYCHLGHGRVMVVFDMVNRWLRASGFDVTYVRNITDIDDKIIKRANENNETIGELTARFITAMDEDAAKLGVMRPDIEPRATDYIGGMVSMIVALIANGNAYAADNGDVFYSVNSFANYGKLSGKSLEDLRAGERVEIDAFKRDPMDFVLWKSAKPNEPSWDSPWGKGRPGWHIECSVMGEHHLGKHFDIHGGGQDLQFPHHENEIAQSEAAHHCTFVNYWMHNGFIRVVNEKDGLDEKMSKSLGNFFTIRDVLKKYDAETVRFFILRAQYRSPLNYSSVHLDDAKAALSRLYTSLRGLDVADIEIDWHQPAAATFKTAMDDDFNTPEAIAVLFDLANQVNKAGSLKEAGLLKKLASILGLLQRNPESYLQGEVEVGGISQELIWMLINQRLDAKKNKDFALADSIRKELLEAGIVLEDHSSGTSWRRV